MEKHRWTAQTLQVPAGSKLEAVFQMLNDEASLSQILCDVQDKFSNFWSPQRTKLFLDRVSILKAALQTRIPLNQLGEIYGPDLLDIKRRDPRHGTAYEGFRTLAENYRQTAGESLFTTVLHSAPPQQTGILQDRFF